MVPQDEHVPLILCVCELQHFGLPYKKQAKTGLTMKKRPTMSKIIDATDYSDCGPMG
jgi:hypothetical protein